MATAAMVNGVNVEQLNGMIASVKQNPGLARTTFHSKTHWEKGFQNKADIGDYEQGGGHVSRAKHFYLNEDHPQGLLGSDTAPTAIETLLAAVGACVSGGWATFGAAMGIPIEKLDIELDGDVDLQGFMGLGGGIRPGLGRIRGKIYVKSNASDQQLRELKETAENHSPVVDSLRVPVELTLVRI